MLETASLAFVALLVTIDPIGLVPIFLALTPLETAASRRLTALKGVAIGGCILLAFVLIGEPGLRTLGISIPAFRIAGGITLLLLAVEMVFERRGERRESTAERMAGEHDPGGVAAFPLAMPLVAGPAAITTVILQMSRQQGDLAGQADGAPGPARGAGRHRRGPRRRQLSRPRAQAHPRARALPPPGPPHGGTLGAVRDRRGEGGVRAVGVFDDRACTAYVVGMSTLNIADLPQEVHQRAFACARRGNGRSIEAEAPRHPLGALCRGPAAPPVTAADLQRIVDEMYGPEKPKQCGRRIPPPNAPRGRRGRRGVIVLDSSALIALLFGEPGPRQVEAAMRGQR